MNQRPIRHLGTGSGSVENEAPPASPAKAREFRLNPCHKPCADNHRRGEACLINDAT